MIYLDANATTPLHPEVLEAMLPWLRDQYANPSGAYAAGKAARRAIDRAREQVAALIGADPEEIVFTGGGTESVNTALYSLDALSSVGKAVVSSIEHSAVLRYVESLARATELCPVGVGGRLDLEAFRAALDHVAFVSIMTANNETGVIQPIHQVVSAAHDRGIPVHTDAIQAVGKIPVNVRESEVDLLSLSAHKFHGPKGVGALFVRRGIRFKPLLQGGGQEAGRRSGTENIAGMVGMGMAAKLIHMDDSIESLRDSFESIVLKGAERVVRNGDVENRLPNTSHLSFEGCEAAGLLILLDEAGVACSAGSACMTGKQRPSHVQLAMGIPVEQAKTSLRFSFSSSNTLEEAQQAAALVIRAVEKLRRVQGVGVGPVAIYNP